jgi:hypothetical protein
MARRGVLMPAEASYGIAAGQRLVWAHDRGLSQTIEVTLRTMWVFPMTHHVECVALLER